MELFIGFLEVAVLAGGLAFAVWRFGINRETFTFFGLDIGAKVIKKSESGNLLLVSMVVHVENKGQTKIVARTRKDIEYASAEFLYEDSQDQCKHAGTLKIRPIPDSQNPQLFDWYSLNPTGNITIREGKDETSESDLEQVNYLGGYQDPDSDFNDVHFWLEPNESYDCQVMAWLRPGTYAIKAFFLGKQTGHEEEEYWTTTRMFSFSGREDQLSSNEK